MIRLVCSDIDNTLLKRDAKAPVNGLFARLKANGVLPMLATGRSVTDVAAIFPSAIGGTIVSSYDGALVTLGSTLLVNRPIDRNIVLAFADAFPKAGLKGSSVIYYGAADCFVTGSGDALAMLQKDGTMTGHAKTAEHPKDIKEPVYKISVFMEKEGDFDYLAADWEPYLNCIYHKGRWCEFISHGTDKGLALNLVMERFGIKRDEVMAFGDGRNDFTMLAAADFSYAIEGSPADKEGAADFVTSDVIRTVEALVLKQK